MKIGILNAIPPAESKVDWGGTPVDAYIRFVESAQPAFSYTGYNVAQGELPESADVCDAYIVTGSPKGVYDTDDWIEQVSQFLRDCYRAGKKLVGICFGHQILAHALGGWAEKSAKGWGLGLKTISIDGSAKWMENAPDYCSLYFAHQDQVTRLPPGAELLGSNGFCPNAFYRIDDQVFGIQGHPEFSPEIMWGIIRTLEGKADAGVLETAADSIKSGSPDNQLVARWIVNFLTGE